VRCPYCESESQVIDSRLTSDGVRRRRTCPECKRRFTTYEKLGAPNLKVTKRSGKSEAFSSQKLIETIARVCRDRSGISKADVARLARSIEAELVDEQVKSVESGRIVELVLRRLAEIDKLAHDRLAVNYIDEDGRLRPRGSSVSAEDAGQLGLFNPAEDDS
jgi:transcriptional repressor NrdR